MIQRMPSVLIAESRGDLALLLIVWQEHMLAVPVKINIRKLIHNGTRTLTKNNY
jgi:hypothetical protein